MTIPSTVERVTINTAQDANERIERQTERNIAYYAANPELISARLKELDREWDIERTLEAQAAGISVASVLLGIFVSRKWLYVPAIVSGFLMQHATQGWCPPLPVLRRVGIRTQTEIERERYALKALRGDFNVIDQPSDENATRVSKRILEIVKG